jgi:hypothetical protein
MKKNKKSSHAGMVHVDHHMFLNENGLPKGGVEVEVSKPTETQSVQVKEQCLTKRKAKQIGTNLCGLAH